MPKEDSWTPEPPIPQNQCCVLVCQHSSCLRQGSARVLKALQAMTLPEGVQVIPADCQGQCSTGPTVRVLPDEVWYCRVKVTDLPRIVQEHLYEGNPVREIMNPRIHVRWSS